MAISFLLCMVLRTCLPPRYVTEELRNSPFDTSQAGQMLEGEDDETLAMAVSRVVDRALR